MFLKRFFFLFFSVMGAMHGVCYLDEGNLNRSLWDLLMGVDVSHSSANDAVFLNRLKSEKFVLRDSINPGDFRILRFDVVEPDSEHLETLLVSEIGLKSHVVEEGYVSEIGQMRIEVRCPESFAAFRREIVERLDDLVS